MSWRSCAFESDLTAALRSGAWPGGCEPALRAHVAGCPDCRGLVLVSGALQAVARGDQAAAAPGAPGALWWRAQLRRRYAATQRVTRPVAWAEMMSLGIILVALVGSVVWQMHPLLAWGKQAGAAWAASPALLPVIAGTGALLLAASAVYWLTGRE